MLQSKEIKLFKIWHMEAKEMEQGGQRVLRP